LVPNNALYAILIESRFSKTHLLSVQAASITSGRSSDWASLGGRTFPVYTSGKNNSHPPHSVGHVAEFHRIPDSLIAK
jgi:hypothetical protein